MPKEFSLEELEKEKILFRFLGVLFLEEPKREVIEDLAKMKISDDIKKDLPHGLKLLIEAVHRNLHRLDEWLEDLAVEYARLFIGPKPPPAIPYASFYLSESKSLMTEETLKVRETYLKAGFAVKEPGRMLEDHIAVELEFLARLTEKIIEALKSGNTEEAETLYHLRKDFIENHLKLWLPAFIERILDSTQEDFYRGCAYFLKEFFEI